MNVRFTEKSLNDALREYAEEIANFIFTRSQEHHIQNGTPDTGFLLKSGQAPRWETGVCVIHYNCEYARDIEWGSDPHWVDYHKLAGWAHRKLGVAWDRAESVAFLVARKIASEGTRAQPFLRPAIAEAEKKYHLKRR